MQNIEPCSVHISHGVLLATLRLNRVARFSFVKHAKIEKYIPNDQKWTKGHKMH
jgi:hypothetical protein